jgi:NAD-dependent deacetylase
VPTTTVIERIDRGEQDPSCLDCGGIIKTDVVMFEEPMPVLETNRAMDLAFECDAVLIIGSTLGVYPAAYIPIHSIETGSPLIIANLGPTDLDELATVLVEGPAGQTVPELVKAVTQEHSP